MKALKQFILTRKETSDQGTFGLLQGEGLVLHTAELPWRDNVPRISCIPAGRYICKPYSSRRFPDVYEVTNVPGRSAILLHTGNYAGDTAQGLRSDVLGCIVPGLNRGMLNGQQAVLSSRAAFGRFRELVNNEQFFLLIKDGTGQAG